MPCALVCRRRPQTPARFRLHDIPCFGSRCCCCQVRPGLPAFSERRRSTEEHPPQGLQAKLTARPVNLATDTLQALDTSISALARQLGVCRALRLGRHQGRGYPAQWSPAHSIRDEPPKSVTVLDAFHAVKLGRAMVDEIGHHVRQLGFLNVAADTLAWNDCVSSCENDVLPANEDAAG